MFFCPFNFLEIDGWITLWSNMNVFLFNKGTTDKFNRLGGDNT